MKISTLAVMLADFRQQYTDELKRTDAVLVGNLPKPRIVARPRSTSD